MIEVTITYRRGLPKYTGVVKSEYIPGMTFGHATERMSPHKWYFWLHDTRPTVLRRFRGLFIKQVKQYEPCKITVKLRRARRYQTPVDKQQPRLDNAHRRRGLSVSS